jgi:hypothetical protein
MKRTIIAVSLISATVTLMGCRQNKESQPSTTSHTQARQTASYDGDLVPENLLKYNHEPYVVAPNMETSIRVGDKVFVEAGGSPYPHFTVENISQKNLGCFLVHFQTFDLDSKLTSSSNAFPFEGGIPAGMTAESHSFANMPPDGEIIKITHANFCGGEKIDRFGESSVLK